MAVDLELDFKNYYQEELYMVADVETGVLCNRSGRRMIALTDDFLLGLHRALENECGEKANAVIQSCGRKWGHRFGEGLAGEWAEFYGTPFRELPLALFQSLLIQEFAHNGWGILDLSYEHFEQGVICLSLRGAVMAAIRSDTPNRMSDVLTAGILGGMYSYFMERDVDCLQTQSESLGSDDSRFLISSAARIKNTLDQIAPDSDHEQILEVLLRSSD